MTLFSNRIPFLAPYFVDIQRKSFLYFLHTGLIYELSKRKFFPISTKNSYLSFYPEYYQLSLPDSSPKQAILKAKTYGSKLYLPLQIKNYKTKQIKLQWVNIGNIPLMTKRGHFIINGSPRVIVNQIVRSPGIYYQKKTNKRQDKICYADVIAYRGTWLRLEIDKKKRIWVRLKKLNKLPLLIFLKAVGISDLRVKSSLKYPEFLENSKRETEEIETDDYSHPETIKDSIIRLYLLATSNKKVKQDSSSLLKEAQKFFFRKFFNPQTYDLSHAGRAQLNKKFQIAISPTTYVLTTYDLLCATDYLVKLYYEIGTTDDIDDLKNRKVKASGELIQSQVGTGFIRLAKFIREKIQYKDLSVKTLISTKPMNGALREFFGSSPLSQFMDQTNPLAELTHKRRVSSLGPGGISRETAGMAVRGIHPTYYGRICPIETPEGKNAGLVNSLTVFSRLNFEGFIETPFYSVHQGQIQKYHSVSFLSADQEKDISIAPGDVKANYFHFLPLTTIPVRKNSKFTKLFTKKVEYVSVSPLQMISIATSLIPFLEHDDANRALMGSNMQRQAVPLLLPEKPIVGTGLEARIITDSGHGIQAKKSGFVSYVSNETIQITNFFCFRPKKNLNCISNIYTKSYYLPSLFYSIFSKNRTKMKKRGFVQKMKLGKGLDQSNLKVKLLNLDSENHSLKLHKMNPDLIEPAGSIKFWTKSKFKVNKASPCEALDFRKKISSETSPTSKQYKKLFAQNFLYLSQLFSYRKLNKTNIFPNYNVFLNAQTKLATKNFVNKKNRIFKPILKKHDQINDKHKVLYSQFQLPQFSNTLHQSVLKREKYSSKTHFLNLSKNVTKKYFFSKFKGFIFKFGLSQSKFKALPRESFESLNQSSTHEFVKQNNYSMKSSHESLQNTNDLPFNFNEDMVIELSKTIFLQIFIKKKNLKHIFFFESLAWKTFQSQTFSKIESIKKLHIFVKNSPYVGKDVSSLLNAYFTPNRIDKNTTKPDLKYFFESSFKRKSKQIHFETFKNKIINFAFLSGFYEPFLQNNMEYLLQPYQHSNQDTCMHQRPLVQEGEWVQKADLLTDGAASVNGELALGKTILVAYMPWEGYNFEDAILISQRLVYDDLYTSIHIEKYEIEISDTQYGIEQITSKLPDIPNYKLMHLDNNGIVKLGTWVNQGDILVGKMTPIKARQLSGHEKLIADILGKKKVSTKRDTSLRVPKNVSGRVIHIEILETENIPQGISVSGPGKVHIYIAEKRKIQVGDKMSGRHGNKGIVSRIVPRQDMPYLPDGTPIDMVLNPLGVPSRMNVGQIFECLLGLAGKELHEQYKISCFDEMNGPEASRSLTYSKLFQTRLKTDKKWVFNPNHPGKMKLFDGRTGECFHQTVTVGQPYILKLVHLVDEKIHARSTGPYSLVTQQPLRGRSKHGGQRVGEMEVWALEGFGAAYTLQEILTTKSDDIQGRNQIMRAILEDRSVTFGTPESFKVLVSELQSLCLHIGVYSITNSGIRTKIDSMRLS